MSQSSAYSLLGLRRQLLLAFQLNLPKNSYAKKESAGAGMLGGPLKKKKQLGKLGPMIEKKVLPVETDANRLVGFVCGANILKTGEEVAVKADSEYPEWLWSVRTGPPPPLETLDPNSKEYWRRIRKMAMRRNNKMAQLKKF